MAVDFAISARSSDWVGLVSGSCPSGRDFAPRFLQTPHPESGWRPDRAWPGRSRPQPTTSHPLIFSHRGVPITGKYGALQLCGFKYSIAIFSCQSEGWSGGARERRDAISWGTRARSDGCAEAVLLTDGFTIKQLSGLVIDGFATLERRRTNVGGRGERPVLWMQITEAGRKAIAD
jgi:hypothetical protein